MSRESIDQDLLDRYLAGECVPAEVAGIETYLAAHPDVAAAITRVRSDLDPGAGLPRNTLASLHAIHARIAQADRAATHGPLSVGSRAQGSGIAYPWPRLPFVAGAAIAAAVALLALLHGPQSHAAGSREYTTARGERATVTLTDGTRFTLAPASRLRVPIDYGRGDRVVSLDGEAYFAVVHDVKHPFAVRAASAITTDIGTSFDVRAYASDSTVRVVVAEGRVDVGIPTAAARTPVHAGEMTLVDAHAHIGTPVPAEAALTTWTDGRLHFASATLRDVAGELARWYDLSFTVGDAVIADRRLTATLETGSLTQLLDAVCLSLDLRYERRGEAVVFYSKP